jgi:probable phosphoglycerate mutase
VTDLPELFVLRHGETAWNVEGRLQGHLDSPLTPRGVAQAQAQRAILARVAPVQARVVSSPSPRARRTAGIACDGHAITLDPRLMEIDLGAWTGKLVTEIVADHPHLQGDGDPHLWKFTAPRGERLDDMTARCQAVLDGLSGPTILFTHGLTSRVLRCLALGNPPRTLSDLPGGQGVVHHIRDGQAQILTA